MSVKIQKLRSFIEILFLPIHIMKYRTQYHCYKVQQLLQIPLRLTKFYGGLIYVPITNLQNMTKANTHSVINCSKLVSVSVTYDDWLYNNTFQYKSRELKVVINLKSGSMNCCNLTFHSIQGPSYSFYLIKVPVYFFIVYVILYFSESMCVNKSSSVTIPNPD